MQKAIYRGGAGLPKKGGLGQFAEREGGGAWQEREGGLFEDGVDTPMHTVISFINCEKLEIQPRATFKIPVFNLCINWGK